ncbi:MAG: polysaccharide biosynthesis protein [Opitutaceae bacterium]|nr:polysaccharide biosynthesis protein [Opitutaceae bacterium]
MGTAFWDLSKFRRILTLAGAYAVVLIMSLYLAYEFRFDFLVPGNFQTGRILALVVVVGVKLLMLLWMRQLDTMVTYFSVPDLGRIGLAMAIAVALLMLIRPIDSSLILVPRGVLLIDFVLSVAGLCLLRLGARIYRERFVMARRMGAQVKADLAIVGAGDAGAALARDFLGSPARGFRPVLFLDDDPDKRGKLIHGVMVAGRPDEVEGLRGRFNISKVVIAMPTASGKRVREIVRHMTALGLPVETMPSLEELASGRVKANRIRPVQIEDLLGREQVELDSAAIRALVENKVVMVTGAGGSIGSELCRQIATNNPKRLLMVERSEGSLFLAERQLADLGSASNAIPLVANILDETRMRQIFERYRPEIIFHAAAHKHVFMMERQPAEAVHNNALGTRRLGELALAFGSQTFVLISTDKAINPTSVMGASKRLAELELQRLAARQTGSTRFVAVRFGNVLGSSGSVIPIFREQIERGGPVTVTHPEVTRFFMTIPEAVGLVLQSAVLGRSGDILVLDMGQSVKIVDLARQMIELSGLKAGEDIEIQFTGLKPGEKLYEELQHHGEKHTLTAHPRIMRFTVRDESELSEDTLTTIEQGLYKMEAMDVKKMIKTFVPEYTPFLD